MISYNRDAVGEIVEVGDAVCVLTAGNFIYGHIEELSLNESNDKSKAMVIPDIGYRTSKKNFKLKDRYVSKLDHLVKFKYNPDENPAKSTEDEPLDIQDALEA